MTANGAAGICDTSGKDLALMIRRRALSVREVVTAFLARIDKFNPAANAIVSLRPRADILAEADAADQTAAAERETKALFGLPIAIKDLAMTKGVTTTYGSPIFARFVPVEDDLHVARIRAAGAIIIGKTNAPEFGLGSQTYNPVFGATGNAYNPALTAGGSSGGAAVALAFCMLPIADGSDFGGSLRNPAAYNNVYGFRPSQGRVPAYPAEDPYFSQLSTDGPMGRSVGDLALLLSVQAGYDSRAPLSLEGSGKVFADIARLPSRHPRVGWLGDLGGALPMEPGVLSICERGLALLRSVGCDVEPLVPQFDFEALWRAFVTLRLYSVGGKLKVHYDNPEHRSLMKPEAVWEVEQSFAVTGHALREAVKVRAAWFRTVVDIFARFDFLVLPSAQVFPFPIEQHWPREIAGTVMDTYHRWMQVMATGTLSGCPIISVPVGFDDKERSMGMQIIGRPRGDAEVLSLARAYEETLGPLRPPLTASS